MPFLGREMSAEPDYSEEVAREIDEEIRRVIEEAHLRAHQVLRTTWKSHRLGDPHRARDDRQGSARGCSKGASEEEDRGGPAAEAEEKPSRERKPAPKPKPPRCRAR